MGLVIECEDSVQQAAVCFGRHFVCQSLWTNSQKRKKSVPVCDTVCA